MERPSQVSVMLGERATTEGGELGTAADDASIAVLVASHSGLAPGERSATAAIVQGRLTARRKHGVTLVFVDLAWNGHKVQLVVDCDGSEGGHHLAPLGSVVRAGGAPGRTMRGELSLFCSPSAVELLQMASVPAAGPQQPPSAPAPRFHVTPNNVRRATPPPATPPPAAAPPASAPPASAPPRLRAAEPLGLCLGCRCAGAGRSACSASARATRSRGGEARVTLTLPLPPP